VNAADVLKRTELMNKMAALRQEKNASEKKSRTTQQLKRFDYSAPPGDESIIGNSSSKNTMKSSKAYRENVTLELLNGGIMRGDGDIDPKTLTQTDNGKIMMALRDVNHIYKTCY
jgi:hypothetical protein